MPAAVKPALPPLRSTPLGIWAQAQARQPACVPESQQQQQQQLFGGAEGQPVTPIPRTPDGREAEARARDSDRDSVRSSSCRDEGSVSQAKAALEDMIHSSATPTLQYSPYASRHSLLTTSETAGKGGHEDYRKLKAEWYVGSGIPVFEGELPGGLKLVKLSALSPSQLELSPRPSGAITTAPSVPLLKLPLHPEQRNPTSTRQPSAAVSYPPNYGNSLAVWV